MNVRNDVFLVHSTPQPDVEPTVKIVKERKPTLDALQLSSDWYAAFDGELFPKTKLNLQEQN